jgi:hypothetical protein
MKIKDIKQNAYKIVEINCSNFKGWIKPRRCYDVYLLPLIERELPKLIEGLINKDEEYWQLAYGGKIFNNWVEKHCDKFPYEDEIHRQCVSYFKTLCAKIIYNIDRKMRVKVFRDDLLVNTYYKDLYVASDTEGSHKMLYSLYDRKEHEYNTTANKITEENRADIVNRFLDITIKPFEDVDALFESFRKYYNYDRFDFGDDLRNSLIERFENYVSDLKSRDVNPKSHNV